MLKFYPPSISALSRYKSEANIRVETFSQSTYSVRHRGNMMAGRVFFLSMIILHLLSYRMHLQARSLPDSFIRSTVSHS